MIDLGIFWEIAQLPGLISLFQTRGSYGKHLKGLERADLIAVGGGGRLPKTH